MNKNPFFEVYYLYWSYDKIIITNSRAECNYGHIILKYE